MEIPKAAILSVGNEILKGSVINTNARFLSCGLTRLGFVVTEERSVSDDRGAIRDAVLSLFRSSDLLAVTGGLGPTFDDITKESVAEAFQSRLVLDRGQLFFLREYLRKRRKPLLSIVRKQAYLPSVAQSFKNN